MHEGQLNRRLIEQNAWWATSDWEQDDQDLRGIRGTSFTYCPRPLAGIMPDGLYLLLGPRRVGKSVELKRAIADTIARVVNPRQVVCFTCDGMSTGDLARALRAGPL